MVLAEKVSELVATMTAPETIVEAREQVVMMTALATGDLLEIHHCRGSLTADSKFLGLRAGPRTVKQMGVCRIYTGSGLRGVIPYIQFVLLCYLH
jgi:hypothetical protein